MASLRTSIFHGKAGGKLILTGEHFVVYGGKALALPLDVTLTVTLAKRPDMGPVRVLESPLPHLALAQKALQSIIEVLQLDPVLQGFDLLTKGALPLGRGLGGSAALATAFGRALEQASLLALSDYPALTDFVDASERIAHGNPSGLDASVIISKEALCFQRMLPDGPPKMSSLGDLGQLPLWLVISPRHGSTEGAIKGVRAWRDKFQSRFQELFEASEKGYDEALLALKKKDWARLGTVMSQQNALLEELGLLSEEHKAMIQVAKDMGAFGAKMSGAGLGGALMILAKPKINGLKEALLSLGGEFIFEPGQMLTEASKERAQTNQRTLRNR